MLAPNISSPIRYPASKIKLGNEYDQFKQSRLLDDVFEVGEEAPIEPPADQMFDGFCNHPETIMCMGPGAKKMNYLQGVFAGLASRMVDRMDLRERDRDAPYKIALWLYEQSKHDNLKGIYASYDTIAKLCGCCTKTISRWIDRFAEEGLLIKEHRPGVRTNVLFLNYNLLKGETPEEAAKTFFLPSGVLQQKLTLSLRDKDSFYNKSIVKKSKKSKVNSVQRSWIYPDKATSYRPIGEVTANTWVCYTPFTDFEEKRLIAKFFHPGNEKLQKIRNEVYPFGWNLVSQINDTMDLRRHVEENKPYGYLAELGEGGNWSWRALYRLAYLHFRTCVKQRAECERRGVAFRSMHVLKQSAKIASERDAVEKTGVSYDHVRALGDKYAARIANLPQAEGLECMKLISKGIDPFEGKAEVEPVREVFPVGSLLGKVLKKVPREREGGNFIEDLAAQIYDLSPAAQAVAIEEAASGNFDNLPISAEKEVMCLAKYDNGGYKFETGDYRRSYVEEDYHENKRRRSDVSAQYTQYYPPKPDITFPAADESRSNDVADDFDKSIEGITDPVLLKMLRDINDTF